MESDSTEPLNLGSDQLVTINQLVDIVESIAGVKRRRRYNLDAPKGVRGRNSDNTLIQSSLGWVPVISLEDGLEKTYQWIYDQIPSAPWPDDCPDNGLIRMCIASDCMAWRWQEVGEAYNAQMEPYTPIEISPTTGYCGLAGKP